MDIKVEDGGGEEGAPSVLSGAGASRWANTYIALQSWKARHGNADPRMKIRIGGRVRKKSELNEDEAEELTLGQWIHNQRCPQRGGKARLSGVQEQVCTI